MNRLLFIAFLYWDEGWQSPSIKAPVLEGNNLVQVILCWNTYDSHCQDSELPKFISTESVIIGKHNKDHLSVSNDWQRLANILCMETGRKWDEIKKDSKAKTAYVWHLDPLLWKGVVIWVFIYINFINLMARLSEYLSSCIFIYPCEELCVIG